MKNITIEKKAKSILDKEAFCLVKNGVHYRQATKEIMSLIKAIVEGIPTTIYSSTSSANKDNSDKTDNLFTYAKRVSNYKHQLKKGLG